MQIKLIFTRKVVHLASFWKWGVLELGIGLFTPTFLRNLVPANRDFQQITIAVVDAESRGKYVTVVSQIANRRNVEFYIPAIATTPQDSFTFRTWQRVISKPVHFVIFWAFLLPTAAVEVTVAICLKPLLKWFHCAIRRTNGPVCMSCAHNNFR